MYRIAIEAYTLARNHGIGALLKRAVGTNAWRRLMYGALQIRDWKPILAEKYLVGHGLEIGALHNALKISSAAQVKYVDRLDVPGLRAHYTELSGFDLVDVDIVDDGELLGTIPPASQDFIIANHFVEHCENPLGTIRTHLDRLKYGGLLFYTIPDRKMTFDWKRSNTPFDHLVSDDTNGPLQSRESHYREWARLVLGKRGAEIDETARGLMNERYSIHFHSWDKKSLQAFFRSASEYLEKQFEIVQFRANGPETVVILKREAPSQHGMPRRPVPVER